MNRTGKRYGKLIAVSYIGKNERGRHIWRCKCDCGNYTEGAGYDLGKSKRSCGCLRGKLRIIHGKTKTRTYKSWSGMWHRTMNKNCSSYHYYGGKGIKVCKRWEDFRKFLEDMGESKPGESIDRIDMNGDYKPSNCRWATQKEQARNKRNNLFIAYKGKNLCMSEWAEKYNLKVGTLWMRLKRGHKPPMCFLPVGNFREEI